MIPVGVLSVVIVGATVCSLYLAMVYGYTVFVHVPDTETVETPPERSLMEWDYDTCVEMPPAEMPPICDSIIEQVESGGSGVSLACLSDPKCKFQTENPGVRHR